MVDSITIGNQQIGLDQPCFVIAEAGVNHNGDIELAKSLVEIASLSGADAIKFQTFRADSLVTTTAPKADYQKSTSLDTETQFEMIARLELSEEMHSTLINVSRDYGITFLSSPFDEYSADLLEDLGIPAFKIPSGEITNHPFLNHVAAKKKPMLVSTGMSTLSEVSNAVQIIEQSATSYALLHCVSNYPADPNDVNLLAMRTMESAFQVPVGYSDHTLGNEIPIAAVAMGAHIIEKHFTLNRNMEGPDHSSSLEPEELKALVKSIRNVESALGNGRKYPAASEMSTANVARKSLVASQDIATGTTLTKDMITIRRPGTGIAPSLSELLIGRLTSKPIFHGDLFSLEMFE
ncbi:MAG: N-acetylneuraminate synthase [Chloroflexi bacterium]|nr:N-acetylneuraminate synthase [Chloroflexota bacterium]|tara:strand:+ start:15496 stop:16545 length:1050 start_codon:yes stop_codon:yes gene_type:complete